MRDLVRDADRLGCLEPNLELTAAGVQQALLIRGFLADARQVGLHPLDRLTCSSKAGILSAINC